MLYHFEGVKNLYVKMIIHSITVHPKTIYPFQISYKEGKKRKTYKVPFFYSQKAIDTCLERINFAKNSVDLVDICYFIERDYNFVRNQIIEANKKRYARMILGNIQNKTELEELKLKLKNPCKK